MASGDRYDSSNRCAFDSAIDAAVGGTFAARAGARPRNAMAEMPTATRSSRRDDARCRRQRSILSLSVFFQHLNPPDQMAACRQESPGRPGEWVFIRPKRQTRKRDQVGTAPTRERGAHRIRGEFLLQPEPAHQPVNQRVVELNHQPDLGHDPRHIISTTNVGHFVSQNRAALEAGSKSANRAEAR